MFGINITPTTQTIELALLFLFPVLLWIAYKVEDIYRKKKKAKYYREMNDLFHHKGTNKNIKRELTKLFKRF